MLESITGSTTSTNLGNYKDTGMGRMLEEQTAKLPSDLFLWAAVGSIVGSLAFQVFGKKDTSIFIGEWVPTFLMLGLYNKIVKAAEYNKGHGSAV